MSHGDKRNIAPYVISQIPHSSGGDGESAYQVAVRNGFSGTESEWLISLRGADGLPGNDGATGAPGPKGDTGGQGIQGIQGEVGPQGEQGVTGLQGVNGVPGGMVINVQALTSSPTDSQTVYFGTLPKAPTTTANISRVYIRKNCVLKVAEIYTYSGTAGTNEAWSLYVRKNNAEDTLIATLALNTNMRVFSNTSLNISFVVGDYFEIKGVQPLWATNPLTCIYGGYLYFE